MQNQTAIENRNRLFSVINRDRRDDEAVEIAKYNERISWLNTLWSARKNALIRQGQKCHAQFDASLPETARKNQIVIKTWESLKAEFDAIDAMDADQFAAYYENLVIMNSAKAEKFQHVVPNLKLAKKLLQ